MQDLFSVNFEDGIRCFSGILNGDHLQPVTKKKVSVGGAFCNLYKRHKEAYFVCREDFLYLKILKKEGIWIK